MDFRAREVGPGESPTGSQVVTVSWTDEGMFYADVITPTGEPRTIELTPAAARAVFEHLHAGAELYLSWGGSPDHPGGFLNG